LTPSAGRFTEIVSPIESVSACELNEAIVSFWAAVLCAAR
jgi:hypothetical protein